MNNLKMPDISEQLRVNMGWQCPECFGVNVDSPVSRWHAQRTQYICQDCGCQWDNRRYPLLIKQEIAAR